MRRFIAVSSVCVTLVTGCSAVDKYIPTLSKSSNTVSKAPTTTKITSVTDAIALTPLQQVLKLQPQIASDEHNISIQQVFNQVESPTVGRIIVIQNGLSDDSVSAIRTEYLFKIVGNRWKLQSNQKTYQCYRAKNPKIFQSQLCK